MEQLVLAADPACSLWQQFDVSKAANMYSQLAGVLAGFAFAAIMLLLSRQHRREPPSGANEAAEHLEDTRFATALACAFLGLVASSALYAVLSAEVDCSLVQGRAASSMVLAGVAFAFSIYTLLFAAVQLVSAVSLGAHFRFVVSVVAPPIVILFVVASLPDLALASAKPPDANVDLLIPQWSGGGESFWNATKSASTWIPLAMLVLCLVVWFLARSRRTAHKPRRLVPAGLTALPYGSLVLVVYAVGRSLSGSHLGPGAYLDPVEAWILVGVCTTVVAAQSLFLSLHGESVPSPAQTRLPEYPRPPVNRGDHVLATALVALAVAWRTRQR
ncbi:hypothetical protein SBE55_15685 [Mycolicibacterium sp. 141076]|uniref:hypothetical protein n=1 Tax=Mycolicibacterium sp. 141076 TaxID=3090599 RepID=UPI00299EE56A|nr:hypothetical protein [Mycolicibacterium sp. 141076]MDX1879256.1 hypothetical protein [Mycolicibacterium sp. 141076]